jgi:hypothetical protein
VLVVLLSSVLRNHGAKPGEPDFEVGAPVADYPVTDFDAGKLTTISPKPERSRFHRQKGGCLFVG